MIALSATICIMVADHTRSHDLMTACVDRWEDRNILRYMIGWEKKFPYMIGWGAGLCFVTLLKVEFMYTIDWNRWLMTEYLMTMCRILKESQ
jgi:hypothetical protein